MRVSVVHGYYSSRVPSGENVIVDLQVDALRAAGHDVQVVARHQDEEERVRWYGARAALRVATNRGPDPTPEINAFAPDIVHVHNLFPNFGRTWVRGFGDRLVATMHNYRPMCAAATLFRDGHACTECPDRRSARPAVRHGCFKESRVATLPIALGSGFAQDPVLRSAVRLIVLNDDMRSQYAAVGVPGERIVTVPNFVDPLPSVGSPDRTGPGDHWLYVGRLTEEKGILPLVRSWPGGRTLRVVGSGPLEPAVRAAAGADVAVVGAVPRSEVARELAGARGLVFPSLWPEGLPTVYLEALAAGVPVLAWPQSVVGRLVAVEGTGRVASGDLAADLEALESAGHALAARCREVFSSTYSRTAWQGAIEVVYEQVARTR